MARAKVCSFDVFDTLVARRCVHPRHIFDAVESKSGLLGFAEMRVQAERAIYNRENYDIDGIYLELMLHFNLGAAAARHLKQLEMDEEFEQLIPIMKHIREVRPCDILISDMYLPEPFVVRVLNEKCGLHFNPLFLTSRGKSSGTAWEMVSQFFDITKHTGDNPHSDVAMPSRFGISVEQTDIKEMSSQERIVEELGYIGLARTVREARLALWNTDSELFSLGLAQVQSNFPVIFLTALWLMELSLKKGWKKILFSSRDCFLLHSAFQRLSARLKLPISSSYFFTSRLARSAPSDTYKKYFKTLYSAGSTVVVDICGTGWSLARLFEACAIEEPEIFLMHHMTNEKQIEEYRDIGQITRIPKVNFISQSGDNVVLEAFNTTDHPMVSDVIEVGSRFITTFVEEETSPRYDGFVKFSQESFMLALKLSEKISESEILSWLSIITPKHPEALYNKMTDFKHFTKEISKRQLAENRPTMDLIRNRLKLSGLNA